MKDRIFFDKAFEPFTPTFFYKLIQLNQYSVEDLIEKNDELSLVMLINRLQSTKEFRNLNLPEDYLKNLSEQSTDELLDIIGKVVEAMLRHLKVPEEEVEGFTDQIKERKMGELFECFKDIDLPAARKKAMEKGLAEGRAEGEELLLIKQICKKLAKGMDAKQIAEALEEDESKIKKIIRVAKDFAPEYHAEQIWSALTK